MILVTPKMKSEYLAELASRTSMNVQNAKVSELTNEEKKEIEIILSYGNYGDEITATDLKMLSNLRWIQLLSSGTDQLPMQEIKERNIILTTARGIHGIPISEYVFATLLYFMKNIQLYNQLKSSRKWKMHGTDELFGKIIGIWGTGIIGREIAKKARTFGMISIGVNRSGQQLSEFDEVFPITELEKHINRFDVIASALPSNDGTIHLVNKELIDGMKDDVVFINVGRGDLVVETDLIQAILNDKFKGVALDVFEQEPLSKNSKLWELDNVIMTPHISASTSMYIPRALNLFYDYFNKYKQNIL